MYKIIIDHPMYDQDELFWNAPFRYDTLRLAVMKRKLDICKELGLTRDAAYPMKNGKLTANGISLIQKLFGEPSQFIVEKVS